MRDCHSSLSCVPHFTESVRQTRKIVLRKRYWLYYALTFIAGARRQIFLVFASFLMVEKFGYSLTQITALFLLNAAFNIWLAPLVGKIIGRVGERAALVFEYLGLIGVFVAYAFVEDGTTAAALYVVDHVLCICHRDKNLFSENRGSGRYGQHGQRRLYDQPYCSCDHSSCFRSFVAG